VTFSQFNFRVRATKHYTECVESAVLDQAVVVAMYS